MVPLLGYGQEINYDSLLLRIDTVENPQYKPVVSFSYGVLSFHGDVKNSIVAPVIGNQAGRVNVSTFIGKKRYYVANFNFLIGRLSGNEYSYGDLSRNLNFSTGLYSVGASFEYRFGHLFREPFLVRPYLSVGIESLNFSTKGDLLDANEKEYFYWPDGTIRDLPYDTPDPSQAVMLHRDYEYETDLRLKESTDFGLGTYNQRSLGIPVELGFHFYINRRAFFGLGVSYHYTLTDFIDNVSFEGTSVQGNKGNDSFIYSNISFHFDLFSDPATRTVNLLYADAEFDPVFFDDEDGDFVLDVTDRCPGTPYGIEVDSLGCPVDADEDGVPDYLDREPDTEAGAWVDDEGVTVSEETYQASLMLRNEAMKRENVEAYLTMIRSDYRLTSSVPIPEQFTSVDEDDDGYISFDELLKAVDLYFDYQLELNIDELRQLNEFFFSQ
jgi:hypothetical protein